MQTTVETLNPTRVRLTVEVPFTELEPALKAAYGRIAQQVRVPGFRPGKVPARVIDQRVGRGAVLEEAVQQALPTFYATAVREQDVAVMAQPEVAVTELVDREKLVFTAEVDVRPQLELPPYDALQVTVDDAGVDDEAVDSQLAGLQDRFATLSGVDRAVEAGDYVSLDLAATIDGEPVPGGEATGVSYEVGSGTLVPGLDDAITGLSEGEEVVFDSELVAGEQAGRTAQVRAVVKSVKAKEVPALDDEFAQTASEFDTIEELRADVRGRLERVARLEQGVAARDKALEVLLEQVEVPVPASVVDSEVALRQQQIDAQLRQAGLTREAYLAAEGRTAEDLDAELRGNAEQAVKAQLVLDAIADAEQVGVDDSELSAHVVRRAQQAGVSPDQYAQQVVQAQQLGALVAEVRRGKALAQVLETATVTDTSGNAIDLEQLAAEASGDAVDEQGRRYHTHADGSVHYLDDEADAGADADATGSAEDEQVTAEELADEADGDDAVEVAPAGAETPGDEVTDGAGTGDDDEATRG